MDSAQNQLVEKLHSATNILVTVSRNPSVDQLSACVGLTLLLNKFGKHATAVFSGEVPSTMEFLEPESTLEKTTDSLRDFIIALDKSKADKLRYKVEDEMVRIFITPYRTSISQNDLIFSQGDFNVDVVIALGVQHQEDLDEAITNHGRILHDAVVSSINTHGGESLGSINWTDTVASSLSELVYDLGIALNKELLDGQIATALLTGIVAETARFSNEKTTPQTMNVSAALMAAGANQQLVASKLEEPTPVSLAVDSQSATGVEPEAIDAETPAADKPEPGTLEIEHEPESEPEEAAAPAPATEPAADSAGATPEPVDEPALDGPSNLIGEVRPSDPTGRPVNGDGPVISRAPQLITEPPTMGGTLTANSRPEYEMSEVSLDPLSLPSVSPTPLLNRSDEPAPAPEPTLPRPITMPPEAEGPPSPAPVPQPTPPTQILTGFTPPPPAWVPPFDNALNNGGSAAESAFSAPAPQVPTVSVEPPAAAAPPAPAEPIDAAFNGPETLAEIEESVHSPHVDSNLNLARDEVMQALNGSADATPEPIQALNAQPLGDDLRKPLNFDQMTPPNPAFTDALQQAIPTLPPTMPNPAQPQTGYGNVSVPPAQTIQPSGSAVIDPTAPPPVPPPIPFNFGGPQPPSQQ
jgi:nanoRNase/pAp phosphatase (c-di-AMP/oligoRNAs hydrolase)